MQGMVIPFQRLQRSAGFLAKLPKGKAISYHLLCCLQDVGKGRELGAEALPTGRR